MSAQLAEKREALLTALPENARKLEVELDPPRSTPLQFRNKLLQPIRVGDDGRAQTGLFARGTQDLVTIESCHVQDPSLTRFARRAEVAIHKLGLRAFDPQRSTGRLRALFARLVPGSQELLLGFVTTPGEFAPAKDLAQALKDCATGLRDARGRRVEPIGVVQNLNDTTGNALFGNRDLPLLGRDHQVDRVGKLGTERALRIQVSMRSFYQVHRGADAILFRPALEMLGPLAGAHVIDGYGGVGTFGLRALVAGAEKVTLIENGPTSCRDAEQNLRRNGLEARGEVVRESFESFVPRNAADVLIVDPPRKGLGPEGIAVVRAIGAERVLYVSCSTRSLARDLAELGRDHRIQRVRLVDLFPHTSHLESAIVLQRERSAG